MKHASAVAKLLRENIVQGRKMEAEEQEKYSESSLFCLKIGCRRRGIGKRVAVWIGLVVPCSIQRFVNRLGELTHIFSGF